MCPAQHGTPVCISCTSDRRTNPTLHITSLPLRHTPRATTLLSVVSSVAGEGGTAILVQDSQLHPMGSIMLTIGKNIQLGYSSWMTNRIRAILGTLGLERNSILWNDPVCPSVTAMNTLSTYLSASYWIRREIFRIYWAAALEINTEANLFKDVISLLKGTSMTYIILIDVYLYSRYRELLSIRLLADNYNGMVRAWEYLATSTS